jgi:hypothetical protein
MSKQQWGHGWHTGREVGEAHGELLGHGAAEIEFGRAADRLTLLARGLQHEANVGTKSAVWWELYASVLAKQLHEVAEQLPGVLGHFPERAPPDEPPHVP